MGFNSAFKGLNRLGRQFSRLLAVELCASAVVMLDTPCSEVVWRVLATHFIRQFPLHFPSRASPCAITFQLDCTADLLPTKPLDSVKVCALLERNVLPAFVSFVSVPWDSRRLQFLMALTISAVMIKCGCLK